MRTATEDDMELRKETVSLHVSGGLTQREIAERYGISTAVLRRWWASVGYKPGIVAREEAEARIRFIISKFKDDEKSAKEIASMTGVTVNTVRQHLRRAGLLEKGERSPLGYPSARDVREGRYPGLMLCPRCTQVIRVGAECSCQQSDEARRRQAFESEFDSLDGWWRRNTVRIAKETK